MIDNGEGSFRTLPMTTDSDATYEGITEKVWDTAINLEARRRSGVISNREFLIAINAIYDSTSGFIPASFEVSDTVKGMNLEEEKQQVVFTNGTKVYVLNRNKKVTTITDALTKVESNLKVWDYESEAADHLRKLGEAMRKKGFTKL